MTPVNRPEIRAPGNAAAETAGKEPESAGDEGTEDTGDARTACPVEGAASGVATREGDGEEASTTHILWLRVATSFATQWARVAYGLTWKTGNESFPSPMPLSERITEMK